MNSYSAKADPWPKILDLLFQYCACGNAASHPVPTTTLIKAQAQVAHTRQSCKPAFGDTQDFWACVTINVLELTESYATIGWYDPTRCRYEDQRWRRFRTLRAGVCAMTGAPIVAGTDVFHPIATRSGPANADTMILAHALQCVGAAESARGAG
ncbi:DUF3331 domain-containing protein [Pararobbsia alpina]|uniref:DUF3331 domain-containing protein n=1 Tax=Pararobbsia alpina TaxID=621374 RepID=A0A6S7BXK2_9BURK|nr:DUF3331 domain-containing protein [Pararobbsia alpina]CAB3807168.1 hypothetical protein LMG28138_05893 [Pararobbsia alpina]